MQPVIAGIMRNAILVVQDIFRLQPASYWIMNTDMKIIHKKSHFEKKTVGNDMSLSHMTHIVICLYRKIGLLLSSSIS